LCRVVAYIVGQASRDSLLYFSLIATAFRAAASSLLFGFYFIKSQKIQNTKSKVLTA